MCRVAGEAGSGRGVCLAALTPERRAMAEAVWAEARHLAWAEDRRRRLPPAAAEDLVSAAGLGLAEAAGSFRPDTGASWRTWWWRRVRGQIRNDLKAEAIRLSRGGPPECSVDAISSTSEANAPAELAEVAVCVRAALAELGRDGEIVARHYGIGCDSATLRDLSAIYGKSFQGIRWIEKRTIRILRHRLREVA